MKTLAVAALLALLLIGTSAAQSDRSVLMQLQISRTPGQNGTIRGTYNGMAVEGSYTGTAGQGTWTLFASGTLLASGTYACDETGCTFTGR